MTWLLVAIALCIIVFSHRYSWWRSKVAESSPRILMYHMVSPHRKNAKFNKLRVLPAQFDYQVRWLKEHGWYFAMMSELAHTEQLPDKTVLLTFDDGFADNYLNAHPIIEKYDAKATLYLVVDRFDKDWSTSKKAHHNSGELMREPKLTTEQIEKMLLSGRWELGGHTLTHANLAKLSNEQKKTEIMDCKIQLEQQFSTNVSSFAYPFGIYDDDDVALTKAAGYRSAVTTETGIDANNADIFRLKRVKISGKDNRLAFWLRIRSGFRGRS
tara:strand:+ start:116213 stop:117022 length:810 start_codon:yes stop_codon:yes gene_type:complete